MTRLSLALLLVACANAHPEPCTQANRAKIDVWYQNEILVKCASKGHDTEDCPDMPAIDAEYDRRYDDWVACK